MAEAGANTRKPSAMQPALSEEEMPPRDVRADEQQEADFLKALETLTVPELNQVLRRAQTLKDAKLDGAKQDFLTRVNEE